MFKNKLNNYLILEIIKNYFFVLLSLSILIWIVQAAKFLSLVTESGIAVNIYASYVIFIFPKIISQMMIISFMISLFLSITKLLDSKEIEIYWLSGISKIKISLIIFKISMLPTLIALFFFIYLVPYTNSKSRDILAKSEFSIINSLVKKNNFNSPLKKLTIFVNKNDNKGNLQEIFIFEENKTIFAKYARVLYINDKNYLELIDGEIQEKNKNKNITIIKFRNTIFDFTKYQTQVSKNTKLQEQSTIYLFKEFFKVNKNEDPKFKEYEKIVKMNIKEELHKRFFKPLFIPLITFLCCFIFYSNNEKINLNKLKLFIFSITTFLVIFIEILINLSVKNFIFQNILYFFPFVGTFLIYMMLRNYFYNEPRYK